MIIIFVGFYHIDHEIDSPKKIDAVLYCHSFFKLNICSSFKSILIIIKLTKSSMGGLIHRPGWWAHPFPGCNLWLLLGRSIRKCDLQCSNMNSPAILSVCSLEVVMTCKFQRSQGWFTMGEIKESSACQSVFKWKEEDLAILIPETREYGRVYHLPLPRRTQVLVWEGLRGSDRLT